MAIGNFNFKTKGLAMNDAGFGIGFDASLFAKHKLQLLLETNANVFIGDKELLVDAQGRENKSQTIYSIKAGPQFFIFERIALSTTFGVAWHSVKAIDFTCDFGLRLV